MKVALMGSVSSSWYALDALVRGGVEVAGVLGVDESEADRISDFRSLRESATGAGLAFHSFVKVTEPGVETFLRTHQPDLLWVIGLSQLAPKRLLDIAPLGGVGFHPTMLPEGRGRAPVAWTILLGARAAANLFYLTDEPDAGDIIIQREVPVGPDDYSEDLIHRTNQVLYDAILELARAIRSGNLPRTPQDNSKATYYSQRTPEDGQIDWTAPTDQVYRLIRAAGRPYSGAFAHCGKRKLTVWRGQRGSADQTAGGVKPGQVLCVDDDDGVLVATGNGAIWLTEVEVDGGGELSEAVAIHSSLT